MKREGKRKCETCGKVVKEGFVYYGNMLATGDFRKFYYCNKKCWKKQKGGIMKKGFTITEIMIVAAIIGLLAAIVIPNVMKAKEKAMKGNSGITIYESKNTTIIIDGKVVEVERLRLEITTK